ncbi:hypothetical protein EVAR_88972_1 [Eumeta japonica]|uniref:Uncharacterized protein n=1 Tax=Eumeta variegata TaxID=151549 RepID=A0A4C1VQI5_EUMVA|nr:hypothetical protein EVAR_88972_1 [Eumeta japonica]
MKYFTQPDFVLVAFGKTPKPHGVFFDMLIMSETAAAWRYVVAPVGRERRCPSTSLPANDGAERTLPRPLRFKTLARIAGDIAYVTTRGRRGRAVGVCRPLVSAFVSIPAFDLVVERRARENTRTMSYNKNSLPISADSASH